MEIPQMLIKNTEIVYYTISHKHVHGLCIIISVCLIR